MKSILFCIVLVFLSITSCNKYKEVIESTPHYPQFLNELPIEVDSEIQKGPYKDSRKGFSETIECIRQYRFLCYSYPKNNYYPFWLYNLGVNLQNIDQNELAFYELKKLHIIDTTFEFPDDIKRISKIAELQELPNALLLKLAAKLNKQIDFENISNIYTPNNNYSMLQTAYAFAFLKDNKRAINLLYNAIKPESHLRLQKRSSTTAGAVCLAFSFDYKNHIDSLSSWLKDFKEITPPKEYSRLNKEKQPDSYSFKQWQSSYAIINKFKELSKDNRKFKFSNLRNGIYEGKCRGFIDTITVMIEVTANKISDIKVIESKEDRPQTALNIIPKRVLNNKSLKVDAVTSATITSASIIAAIAEANYKAQ